MNAAVGAAVAVLRAVPVDLVGPVDAGDYDRLAEAAAETLNALWERVDPSTLPIMEPGT